MLLPAHTRRLVRGAVALASLAVVPAASAATSYDVTVTGTVQYLRSDVYAEDDQTHADAQQQAALSFVSKVPEVVFGVDHGVKIAGVPVTTVSDVHSAYRAFVSGPLGQRHGACAGTTATVAQPGAFDDPLLAPLVGHAVVLRPWGQLDVPVSGCSGELGYDHTFSFTPQEQQDLGSAAIDLQALLPDEAFQGDVWSGPMTKATASAPCPIAVEGITKTCSYAVEGTITLDATEGRPIPPQPSTGPAGTAPGGKPAPVPGKADTPAKGTATGKPTAKGQWVRGGKAITLRFTCATACRGTVTVLVPGTRAPIGKPVRIDLRKGGTQTVTVRPTPAQRRALTDAKQLLLRYKPAASTGASPSKRTVRVR